MTQKCRLLKHYVPLTRRILIHIPVCYYSVMNIFQKRRNFHAQSKSKMRIWILGTAVLAVAGASFLAGRALWGDEGAASAQSGDTPGPASKAIVSVEGQTIDTSKPDWFAPFLDADSRKPRSNKTVAGVTIGPDVKPDTSHVCTEGEARQVDPSKAAATKLAIDTSFIPAGAKIARVEAVQCRGEVVAHEITFNISPESGLDGKLQQGEANWFDSQHGGAFTVSKSYRVVPALPSNIPDERWSVLSLNGKEAAFARPVLGELGESAIVLWNDGVQTTISGTFIGSDELKAIGGGVR